MSKSIVIIGTLDTKGDQAGYIKQLIEDRGHEAVVIDVGVLGEPPFEPTIDHNQVAQASGSSLEEIIAFDDGAKAMIAMAEGASKIAKELYLNGRLDGILALGGSMGTSVGLRVMRELPFGVPKLMVSTVAYSPIVSPDAVGGDVMMIPWTAGLWGLNSIVKRVLENAAGAISGAVEAYERKAATKRKMVGVTSLGMTTCRYLDWLKPALEERGYEVAVFHTLGMGGRAFEQAIGDGLIDVALDLSAEEFANQVCGSPCTTAKNRMETAGKKGIPQIVAPGPIGGFSWTPDIPVPHKFKNRVKWAHNPLLWIIPTTTEERAAIGKLTAEKLNKATGPVAVILPMQGFSEADREGSPFFDPMGRDAYKKALAEKLKPEIKVVEIDARSSDKAFSDTVLTLLTEMVQERDTP